MFKIIVSFMKKKNKFARIFTCEKHFHDPIISIKRKVDWSYKTSLTHPHFIGWSTWTKPKKVRGQIWTKPRRWEVKSEPNQEGERSNLNQTKKMRGQILVWYQSSFFLRWFQSDSRTVLLVFILIWDRQPVWRTKS
jgi:hypothetical protein